MYPIMKYVAYVSLFSLLVISIGRAEQAPPLQPEIDDRPITTSTGKPIVSYADVLGEATPSVVTVYTSRIVTMQRSQQLPDIFRHFGLPVPPTEPEPELNRERREQLGVCSGVIISEDGYIVTNHHVVQGMRGRAVDEILVRLNEGSEYVATLIGSDSKTDVAVLKIDT